LVNIGGVSIKNKFWFVIFVIILIVFVSGCTSNSAEYKVGNSSFSVPKEYEMNPSFNESKMAYGYRTSLNSTDKSIAVIEFFNNESFNQQLNEFRDPLYKESNKNINGTPVTIFEDTGMPFKEYFFEKNGKYYWIAIYLPDNSNIHDDLANMIISSIKTGSTGFNLHF
jgi:hypothetical protein